MTRFEKTVTDAIRDSVSDIHIASGHPVVFRKHGEIMFHKTEKWSNQEIEDLLKKILTPFQMDTLKKTKSVDISHGFHIVRLRINVFNTLRGISMAIRILPRAIPTIESLNLHPSLSDISGFKSGLVLCCGPTGAGKTTTISAIIEDINTRRNVHIITLENPIEFRFLSNKAFIQQRELGTHMPSMAQGMLDVLRENPDVIVIGEMRKAETMQLALNAAESGHLVIASIHASNPEEAVYRMCNSVPHEAQDEIRYQLSLSLAMVVTQQLVYMEKLGFRVPLLSIVRAVSSVKNLIRENKLNQLKGVIQMSRNEGMFTPESYMTEYLATKRNFFHHARFFNLGPKDLRALETQFTSPGERISAQKEAKVSVFKEHVQSVSLAAHERTDDATVTIDGNDSLGELVESLKDYKG